MSFQQAHFVGKMPPPNFLLEEISFITARKICQTRGFEEIHGSGSERHFLGTCLAPRTDMNSICRHCDELIIGNAYHVTSEEDGVILLDMIVCANCAFEAKCLQLHTEIITSEETEAPALGNDFASERLLPQVHH
jgi:hypothetical protein